MTYISILLELCYIILNIMNDILLSIIVPLFNEERRIDNCIAKLNSYFSRQKYSWELIFVDDGSTDQTNAKIKMQKSKNLRLISYQPNQGKGYAVRQGILAANGQFILFTDADLSTPIENVDKLLREIQQYPIVIGSRYLESQSIKVSQPLGRRLISRLGYLLTRFVLGLPFKDTQCGFKLFASVPAKKIFNRAKISRWGFDIEILAIAQKLGFQIKEVPVSWYNDANSQLRAAQAIGSTLKELIQIKFNLITGKYL